MSDHRSMRGRDIALRLAGLGLLAIGAASTGGLCRLVQAAPAHAGTITEMGLAAAGFLCLSLGSALLSLGEHLLDEAEISARWARSAHPAPMETAISDVGFRTSSDNDVRYPTQMTGIAQERDRSRR